MQKVYPDIAVLSSLKDAKWQDPALSALPAGDTEGANGSKEEPFAGQ